MQTTSIAVPVRNTAEAIRDSLAGIVNTFLSAIPRLIGFALVLVVGWVVSSLLARGVAALLHAIRFNDLVRRSGLADFVGDIGVRQDAAAAIAAIVKWFVRLVTVVVAFDLLGLPAVSVVLQQLLLWLPNLIVALVVMVIGGLAANALSQRVRGATAKAGFSNPHVLASVAKAAVWAFTIVVAVNQLGIATTLIDTLLIGVVGALALASGLAFGLGGRARAGEILDRLGRRAEPSAPKLERATGVGREQVRSVMQDISSGPERARPVKFEEDWTARSAVDRRRVARPEVDRRTGNR